MLDIESLNITVSGAKNSVPFCFKIGLKRPFSGQRYYHINIYIIVTARFDCTFRENTLNGKKGIAARFTRAFVINLDMISKAIRIIMHAQPLHVK